MGGLFSGSKGITWESPGFSWLQPLGRLKPGVTTARAEAILQPLARQIKIELADPGSRNAVASESSRLHLLDGSQGFNFARSEFGEPVSVLMGVAGLVLLIACANVANLLLARANVREREFAIRLSLGASRARLIRQLMVESLAIAGCGGALGLILSVWIVDTLLLYLSPTESLHVSIDPLVICFSASVSLLTAILFGLAPAWQSSRSDLLPGLKDASSAATLRTSRTFFRKAAVVFQVALSLAILFAAGLLTRTLAALRTVDLGFQPANIIALSVDPAMSGYPPAGIDRLYDEILRRLAAGHDVASASLAVTSPLEGSLITLSVEVPGHVKMRSETDPGFNMVSPRYFTTLNQPFLLGRDFSDRDVKSAPAVAVVNERFVQQYMPGQNPLGRHFKQGGGDIEIVGIVGNARFQEIREAPIPIVYLPTKQAQSSGYTLLVKTRGNPERVIAALKRTVHSVNANLPIYNVRTLQAQINEGISSERVLSFLSVLFSALATLLCGIGLYGIVTYSVSRRTREIGVRFAVGAQKSDVTRLFLRESLFLIATGIAIGIPVALAFTRLLKNLLYGLEPTDLATLALTTAVLAIAGLLATFLPIRRAAGIEPREALQYE
jgi:predicted permease